MAYLLMGYDTENYVDPSLKHKVDWGVTVNFLSKMKRVHEELKAPCTLFIVGKLLEEPSVLKGLRELAGSPLFDLQQHTYSHQRLKTVVENDGKKITVFEGAPLEKIREEVNLARKILQEKLGVHSSGITGPFGYYRGLSDRPDVLRVLHDVGIRFTRTYLRNENDWGPLSIEAQPFTYEPQGLPDILEIPAQGWQDVHYFWTHGWDKREDLLRCNKKLVDEIAEKDLVWSVCQHDFSSCQEDPEMSYTKELLSYAQSKGVTVTSHKAYYEKTIGNKS